MSSPDTHRLYRFRRGEWREGHIRQLRSAAGCDDLHGYYYRPSAPATSALEVLPDAIEIVERIAPWATVIAGPRLWCRDEAMDSYEPAETQADVQDRTHYTVGGVVFSDAGLTLLQLSQIAAVDEASDRPAVRGSAYLEDPEERRACLFEHWCMSIIESMPSPPAANAVDEVFDQVWDRAAGAALDSEHTVSV